MNKSGIIAKLRGIGASSLHEAMGRLGALPSSIKPIAKETVLVGPAVTVQCYPGDNAALLRAIDLARPGDVLVVATGHYLEAGYFGEVMATASMARGIAGLVIDGGVRDHRRLRELGFPTFTANVCMKGTVKQTLGPINAPIVINDQVINPGDFVCGDEDGVVIVPAADAETVADAAIAREKDEEKKMALLRQKESLFSMLGLHERFPGA